MQRSLASASRTSGEKLAARRMRATKNATMATSTAAATTTTTSKPLLARSTSTALTSTRTASAPRRRSSSRPLAPPPRASSFLDGLLLQANSKKSPSFNPPAPAVATVDALLEAVEGTDAGAADKTSEEQREEIARLAASLKKYRMRSPAQSDWLWGW